MRLTVLKAKTLGSGQHFDAHGLCLVALPTGSRSWVLRMQYKGHRRDFGVRPVHDVSLAEARCRAAELRKMVRAGLDPVKERGLRRANVLTFEIVARRCYEARSGGWKDRRHASWLSSLENHVFSEMGTKRIDAIGTKELLLVLGPIWLTIPDTARGILQRIGAILYFTHIKGYIPAEVSLLSVTQGLPRQQQQVTDRAAMPT